MAKQTGAPRRRNGPPKGAVAIVVVALIALAGVFLATRPATAHPQPRAEAGAHMVAPPTQYAAYPRIEETYRMAAEIPQVLDGLYCYCDCSHHSEHYSLLDCFRDDHGAGCDICLTQAQLAYQMTNEGKSLEDIRQAVDELYAH